MAQLAPIFFDPSQNCVCVQSRRRTHISCFCGQSYAADDLVPEWDALCLTGHSQARSNSFFEFTYEVGMTFDATGTAPAVVYPLPGGGDVPPFPPTRALRAALRGHEDPTKAPLFSRIFYEKGATVNRMVVLHLGFSAWDSALASHLRRFQWANPTVEDLMRSLDGAFRAAGSPSAMSAMYVAMPWCYTAHALRMHTGRPLCVVPCDVGMCCMLQAALVATTGVSRRYSLVRDARGGGIRSGLAATNIPVHPHSRFGAMVDSAARLRGRCGSVLLRAQHDRGGSSCAQPRCRQ
jgi:hypothetical protein